MNMRTRISHLVSGHSLNSCVINPEKYPQIQLEIVPSDLCPAQTKAIFTVELA